MIKKVLLILFILLSGQEILAAESNIYNLLDLDILAKQKSYREFFSHAQDIRPSKRNNSWKKTVKKMALEFISNQIDNQQFRHDDFILVTSFSLWPSLKNDTFYQIKKNNYGGLYFDNCFKTHSELNFCKNRLYTFWHSGLQSPELAMKLAKLVKKHITTTQDLWPFYKKITQSPASNFFCNKKEVYDETKRTIINHIQFNDNLFKIKKSISKIANKTCIKAFSGLLKEDLYHDNDIIRNTSYLVLKSHSLISKKEEDLYLTHYLLSRPKTGNLFNRAFNRIKVLGQNFKRRMVMINQLKRIDPLPGNIFSNKNLTKRKTLFRLLASNIPEYIKYYGATCVRYLQGKGDFPLGTPTVECDDFFKTSKGTNWINQTIRTQYSSVIRLPNKK